jgi:hypothetical protein
MGLAAARHLLARRRGEEPSDARFETPLCVRRSTAPPARA